MTDALRTLAGLVHDRSGMVLRDGQLATLASALRRVDPALRPEDVMRDAARGGVALDALIDEITVKETFFLRHLDELADVVWPALAAAARADGRAAVRVWSAGCASGEEAYTLAMLAAEAGDIPVDVLGTDIAPSALEQARRGVYNARSLRLLDDARRARWIESHPRGGRVGPSLRTSVRFAVHNLIDGPVPPAGEGPFDLIVCRNVLIYFDAATVAATIARLRTGLTPGGQMIIGTADRLSELPDAPLPPPPHAPATPVPIPATRGVGHSGVGHRKPPPVAPRERPPEGADDAVAAFEAGTAALGQGDGDRAVVLLRRALYLDPAMAVAALQLGRTHELRGDAAAARHAYHRALRLAEAQEDPAARLYDRIGVADVVLACDARLRELEP